MSQTFHDDGIWRAEHRAIATVFGPPGWYACSARKDGDPDSLGWTYRTAGPFVDKPACLKWCREEQAREAKRVGGLPLAPTPVVLPALDPK